RALHTRNALDTRDEPGEDVHFPLRAWERRIGEDETERREPRSVEAAVHSHQLPEASEQQPCADDQDNRQGDFRHHERVASPRAGSPGGCASTAFVQSAAYALLPHV